MVSTFTPKGYELPGTGDYVDSWGPVINGNFSIIDANFGGAFGVSLSNVNVTLTPTQARNLSYFLSGTLSANVSVIFPQIGSFYIISNTTVGAFSVTVRTAAGGGLGVVVPRGLRVLVFSDGTNFYLADDGGGVPIGTIVDFAGGAPPSGWLLCDGSAISRSTFSALFGVIDTTYGAGNGSTTFNVPDGRGRNRAGRDNMGGVAANRLTLAGSGINATILGAAGGVQNVTLAISQIPSHDHPGSLTSTIGDHFHQYFTFNSSAGIGIFGNPVSAPVNPISLNVTTGAGSHFHDIFTAAQGGSASHLNMSPTIVFDTIIRAF